MDDKNSLSHTRWNCKYHIVFAPKYRRKIIYGDLKKDIGQILRQLCKWKDIKLYKQNVITSDFYVEAINGAVKKHGLNPVPDFMGMEPEAYYEVKVLEVCQEYDEVTIELLGDKVPRAYVSGLSLIARLY